MPAEPVEHDGEMRSSHSLEDFLRVSEATAAVTEQLAACIDRTKKPYAHRKAATLRKNQAELDKLLSKLVRLQNEVHGEAGLEERWSKGEASMQTGSAMDGEVDGSGAPDYRAISLQLYEYAHGHEHEDEDGYESEHEHEHVVADGTKVSIASSYLELSEPCKGS